MSTKLLEKCKSKLKWDITSYQWMAFIKNPQIINSGASVERREPSYTVGRNVNCYCYYREQYSLSCSVMSGSLWLLDCSPPGSSVHGIFQARILELLAIPYSRDLPDPEIEPTSLWSLALAFTTAPPGKPQRTVWMFLRKLKIELPPCNPSPGHISGHELPYDPAIPALHMIWKDTCTPVFTAALFAITKTWKQAKHPSAEEWMKMW